MRRDGLCHSVWAQDAKKRETLGEHTFCNFSNADFSVLFGITRQARKDLYRSFSSDLFWMIL